MSVIGRATSVLWIRPLVCFNKQGIVDFAKEIGTYDLSIEEYADCCSFLLPKHPVTRADESLVRDFESRVSEAILEDAFNNSFRVR